MTVDTSTTDEERVEVNDGYIMVKKDYAVRELKLCAPTPKRSPTSRYLIAVTHRLKPSLRGGWNGEVALRDNSYSASFAMQQDSLLVWQLAENAASP
jgi:hypothetical protein